MYKQSVGLFLLFSLFSCNLLSQQYTPLRERIYNIEKKYKVSFSYDDQLIEPLVVTSDSIISLEQELLIIAKQTGLTFGLVDENIILIQLNKNNFCAILQDSESRLPIKNAQVLINNKPFNTLSNEKGKVTFNGAYTFQDSISFKHIGYNNQKFALGKLTESNCITVPLVFNDLTLNEVVITNYMTTGINASKKDHSLIINTDELALLPGETDGDVLAAIKTLPGITSPNGKVGNLHFRGSTTDQTLLLFDNMPIYHKGHYLGAISPYNPTMIDEIKVYRSGYSAELGGRVGGAIEINSDRSIPDSAQYGLGLNTVYGSAFAKIPVSDNWSINGSFRSSYSGTWTSPKLEAIEDIVYSPSPQSIAEENETIDIINKSFTFKDINLNTTYNTNSGQFFFSYIDVNNKRNFEFLTPRGDIQKTDDAFINNGGSLNWINYWAPNISTEASLTYSDYQYSSKIHSIFLVQDSVVIRNEFLNEVTDINFKSSVQFENDINRTISLGYEVNHTSIHDDNYGQMQQAGAQRAIFDNESYLHSIFGSYSNRFADKLNVTLGLRNSYYTKTKDYRIEPRITTTYDLSKRTTLKASAGLYSQYIRQNVFFDFEDLKAENLTWSLADDDTPYVKSAQSMIGTIFNFNSIIIDIEGYYKTIDNLLTQRGGRPTPGVSRFITGTLDVFGGDILIRKHWNNFDTWINYSYLNTSTSFPDINQQEFLTYYDQPHTLNITGTATLNNWKFSLGWFISSGAPNYLNNTFFPEPGPNQPPPSTTVPSESNDGRFPEMHQLDVAAVYQIPNKGKKWKASVGVSALNVYDQKNLVEEGFFTFGRTTIQAKRYNIGFAPNVMLNIEF